jgi:signal transduction histidine kinase/CheY-like chemotaxis protein/ABC-type amino acid transport substrate-binding protein/HPt (histidine-containing phosphotransfer) domain-containing protein
LNAVRGALLALLLVAVQTAAAAPAPALTPAERAWVRSAPPVVVGVQSDSAPYSYVDARGRATGYSNELFRLAASKVGLRYRFAPGLPWEALWPRAQAGDVDVLTFLWRMPARERYMRYVEPPYIAHALVFAVRADDPDPPRPGHARGKVFALGRDFASNAALRARFPDAVFVEVDSVSDALRLVALDRADAYVDDRGTINYVGAQLGLTNLREGASLDLPGTHSYMAVRRDAPMLQQVLAKGLASVSPDERAELDARWLRPSTSWTRRLQPYLLKALPFLPLIALALAWLVYSNRRLAREVRLRRAFEHEAKTRAATLAEREAFQRGLLDVAQAAIMVLDGEGRWVVFNRFAEQLLGWRADEMLGRTVRENSGDGDEGVAAPRLLHPDELQRVMALLQARSGEPMAADWRAVYRFAALAPPPQRMDLVHRDGHRVPVLLSLAAVTGADGRPSGLIAIANDLGAQVRLEDELRASEARANEANHAKSAFLAAMSHEIRTPLIGVTGMVEVLAHGTLDAEQRRAVNIVQASSDSLLRIVGDILDFSKIEAGRLELASEPVDLARLVRMVTANFANAASSKGIAIACRIDPRLEGVGHLADPLRLRQVLSNLLSNAVKFTEAGGVEVVLDRLGRADDGIDTLCLRVIDSGIGIAAEAQAHLFEPFAQAGGDTAQRFGGTGLGLAISRRLAALMGGELSLQSTPGQGTTVRLQLALATTALPAASPTPDAVQSAAFAPRRLPDLEQAERERSLVLLVDDHPTNRLVIARQLALAGYASEGVADGRDGLEHWRSGRFALVLTDVHMPDMDGYALARAIRAAEADAGLPRTPIVALTAAAVTGEAERCLAAGMDDFLTKPVDIGTLATTLRRWLPHTAAATPADAAADSLPQLDAPLPLDPGVLAPLTGDDPVQLRAVLDDFLGSTARDLAALEAAHGAGDDIAVRHQAHRISGAARLVGAVELAAAARALEGEGCGVAGRTPRVTDVATALSRLSLFVDARWPRA